ncbi:MAG: tRNA lysidine(34) synthetase TilS [Verrucomicrobiaceae bacterium]|nr:MAG: tRNA lysidine(34) synthetase TilS [Verrucomicrobiaceae bacterium]
MEVGKKSAHIPSVTLETKIPWLARAPRGRRWLVGVSGGADSVALLHLLLEAGFRDLVVCHLDHRLRGRDSTLDAEFVLRLCGKLGVPCESERADVRKRMAETGESMETAARNARHEFFARCAARHRCRRILLAHHADDQAETVLWNLLRGSHGLKGMRDEQQFTVGRVRLQVVRPLLGVRRHELVGWLQERRHRWREDASNREPVAIRNRLRNEVMPLLAEISGRDPVAAFARGAEDTVAREELENELLQQADLLDPQGRLHLPALRKLSPNMQRAALCKFLRDQGIPEIDRVLLKRSLGLLETANPAVVNLPGGRRLRRREGRIWIGD